MCFSWFWLRDILIWIVVIAAVIGILKLIVPPVLAWAGVEVGAAGSIAMQAIKICIGAIVLIFLILFCFELISCLMGYGGGSLSFPRH